MGTIEKSPVAYNPPWHFHLKPETVSFFEVAPESCHSTIEGVGRLSDAGEEILSDSWCSWSSLLTKEVHPVSKR